MTRALLESHYPFFGSLDPADRDEFAYLSYTQPISPGDSILSPGNSCRDVIVVLEGRVRSMMVQGCTSILLYQLNPGDICILGATDDLYDVSARITLVCEEAGLILKTPGKLFSSLRAKYPELSRFLRANFMDRFSDILYIIQGKALSSSKQQVAGYLYDISRYSPDSLVDATQRKIAADTAVSRSQVSTILGELECEGLIRRSRGKIKVLEPVKLQSVH